MRLHLRKKGFTLIEIIVSMGIIGIIVVAWLPFFVNSFKNIFYYGRTTKSVFEAQTKMENAIGDVSSISGEDVKPSSIQIKIYSSDRTKLMQSSEIAGNTITINTGDKNEVTLITFVPSN